MQSCQQFDGPCSFSIPDPASQSISLDDSGNPLSIVKVNRGSPNFDDLTGYLSPPPVRLTTICRVKNAC